jgi:hypothetical protein
MGFPTSEVGYTSATTGRGDHEVHKGHVVALKKIVITVSPQNDICPHGSTYLMNSVAMVKNRIPSLKGQVCVCEIV